MKAATSSIASDHLAQALSDLRHQVERYTGGSAGACPFLRFEVQLPAIDPLAWLAAQQGEYRSYWRDRTGRVEFAACGQADSITAVSDDITQHLKSGLHERFAHEHAAGRYFGGMCFDPKRAPCDDWRPFGQLRLVLPRWELSRTADRSVLAWHVAPNEVGLPPRPIASLAELAELDAYQEAILTGSLCHTPDRDQWDREMSSLLPLLARGPLQKLVLDRQSTVAAGGTARAWAILARLRKNMSASYLFGISPAPGYCFVGASPERLYAREGHTIATEAVAGTRPRGRTVSEDVRLERDLLSSDKERREHGFVAQHIAERLDGLCDRVAADTTPQVIRLPRLMHRIARFEGRLRSHIDDADILHALHPTAAVGGYPAADALEYLRTSSPVNRGWYSGPVGFVSAQSAEFAVAIRSALITPRQVAFFAGAGIVEGSKAEAEWGELDNKLRSLLEAFST